MVYGTTPREMPKILPAGTITLAGATVPVDRLVAVAVAAVVLTGFSVFFRRSRHGIAMRAVADDQQAALVQGISVRRVFALAWALAAVSALIAGVLLADIAEVSQNLATFGLAVFPVVILGGLDSVAGTIVGGVVIGLVSQYAEGASAGTSQVVPYVALVLILLLRPYGLFGQPRIERV
jgi:branched-chain amino acid transport system permease protein